MATAPWALLIALTGALARAFSVSDGVSGTTGFGAGAVAAEAAAIGVASTAAGTTAAIGLGAAGFGLGATRSGGGGGGSLKNILQTLKAPTMKTSSVATPPTINIILLGPLFGSFGGGGSGSSTSLLGGALI